MGPYRVAGPALAVSLLLGPRFAPADVLELVAGGQWRLPATIEGDRVIVEAPDGPVAFPRSEFRGIVPEPDPRREWPARAAAAQARGPADRVAAALWALDRGLVPEAEAMVRSAHRADPDHQPSARMVAVLDRLALTLPDPDLAAIARGLPPTAALARGPHVVLMHQHPEREAAERVEVLEAVITAYYLSFAAMGLDLPTPTSRLPSMWFADRGDYLAYVRAEGDAAFLTTRGYHHPTRGLVVAYDRRGDPEHARKAIAVARRRKVSATAPGGRGSVAVDRDQLTLDLERREIDLGVAAHETVHQLVAASRLAPRPDAWPTWLHEGLAMQFEAISGARWAGLGRPSPWRLADYRRLDPPPRLLPILRDEGYGRGYRPEPYAKAWALAYYLRREQPRAFLALLDGLALPAPADLPTRQHFEKVSRAALPADPEEIEARWHLSLRTISSETTPPPRPRHPD